MTVNEALARSVAAKIREVGVEGWDQRMYVSECGTRFCFAGWTLRLSGYGILEDGWGGLNFCAPGDGDGSGVYGRRRVNPGLEAAKLLGLDDGRADEIFFRGLPLVGVEGQGEGVEEFLTAVGEILGLEQF